MKNERLKMRVGKRMALLQEEACRGAIVQWGTAVAEMQMTTGLEQF